MPIYIPPHPSTYNIRFPLSKTPTTGLLAWLNVPAAQIQYECFGPLVAEVDAAGLLPTY